MDITLTLLSCMAFMALVAVISYMKTKGEVNTQDGYFLAGRGLTGTFIAGSMILTNLSAEQLKLPLVSLPLLWRLFSCLVT